MWSSENSAFHEKTSDLVTERPQTNDSNINNKLRIISKSLVYIFDVVDVFFRAPQKGVNSSHINGITTIKDILDTDSTFILTNRVSNNSMEFCAITT